MRKEKFEGIVPKAPFTLQEAFRMMTTHPDRYAEQEKCEHTKTVCINEEGNAGVFCADCGKQLEKEC